MRFCILFLFIFSISSFAETKITAVLPKGRILIATTPFHKDQKQILPANSYDVDSILASEFKLMKTSDISLDMSKYNLLMLKAKLELSSNDQQSGYYQFKFTFLPEAFFTYFNYLKPEKKFKILKGNVIFDANRKSSIILEGKINHSCKIPQTETVREYENRYLMYVCLENNTVSIITAEDIPITIKSD